MADLPGVKKGDLTEIDDQGVDVELRERVHSVRVPKAARAQPRRIEIKGG